MKTISKHSPASLQIFGWGNLPIVTRTGEDGVMKVHYQHGLDADRIAKTIENGLKRPLLMFQHKWQYDVESVWVVTNEKHNGNHIILAIHPEKLNREGGKQQLIATAYDVASEAIARKIVKGDLVYRDTNAEVPQVIRKAVTDAQIKYAREPRMILGVIPNTALIRKHSLRYSLKAILSNLNPAMKVYISAKPHLLAQKLKNQTGYLGAMS